MNTEGNFQMSLGTMGAGKTKNLIAMATWKMLQGGSQKFFKPAYATRDVGVIRTRADLEDIPCHSFIHPSELLREECDILYIDELHMVDPAYSEHLVESFQTLLENGTDIFASGLVVDHCNEPFEVITSLLRLYPTIRYWRKKCENCKDSNATVDTLRELDFDKHPLHCSEEEYQSLCRSCFIMKICEDIKNFEYGKEWLETLGKMNCFKQEFLMRLHGFMKHDTPDFLLHNSLYDYFEFRTLLEAFDATSKIFMNGINICFTDRNGNTLEGRDEFLKFWNSKK